MCTVCGCAGTSNEAGAGVRDRAHGGGHSHGDHHHPHGHTEEMLDSGADAPIDAAWDASKAAAEEGDDGLLDFGAGPAGVHVAGQSQRRLIAIERDILSKNDQLAAANRAFLADCEVVAVNMMSSPGAGKTTLLVETLKALRARAPATPCAVIEGDQHTSNDAARIRATGAPAVQINTGKGCHLDAEMVRDALRCAPAPSNGFLFIENVGNLVCPAAFDLGETRRVVVVSVTEGEDKPLKYPEMFASADAVVVTKIDLLPHLAFDVDALIENARRINPRIDILRASSMGEPGVGGWLAWLDGLWALRRAAE